MEHLFTDFQVAELLSQSLKYIKLYRGQTVVIKYGGNAMKNPELQQQVMHDLVLLNMIGVRVVLVHGGGPSINQTLNALGIESRFLNGLRVTDQETMRVVQMVLAGQINKDLVRLINDAGGRAIGLCGLDASIMTAKARDPELGCVGEITDVNVKPIEDLLNEGFIPVIASVAGGENASVFNLNADTAAAALAGALKAKRLVLMTDIDGLRRDVNDPESLISDLPLADIPALTEQGIVSGGMIPKLACAQHAIESGVERVAMINGTLPHSIIVEMLTKGGIGTLVRR